MLGVEPVLRVVAGLAASALIDLECALPDAVLRSVEFRSCRLTGRRGFDFGVFLNFGNYVGNDHEDPHVVQGLRDKMLQNNCLSSENLKGEICNSALT